jgi:hypothetical protein
MAQTRGIVYILPQHSDESVPAILAGPCIREAVASHRGQAEHIVEFPVSKQSGVGGDDRAAKLEHQSAVEIEPENLAS